MPYGDLFDDLPRQVVQTFRICFQIIQALSKLMPQKAYRALAAENEAASQIDATGRYRPKPPKMRAQVVAAENETFPLSLPLIQFGDLLWTLGDAVCHTVWIGRTGSGKTGMVMSTFARSVFCNGFGAVVYLTKPDDAAMWMQWARESGRAKDVVRFSPGACSFDVIWYLLSSDDPARSDRSNVIQCLKKMVESGHTEKRVTGENAEFWEAQFNAVLTHILTLGLHSGEKVTAALLSVVVDDIPQTQDDLDNLDLENSELIHLIRVAQARTDGTAAAAEVRAAQRYLMGRLQRGHESTVQSVLMSLRGFFEQLSSPQMRALTRSLDFKPEDALNHRAIILVDLPDNPGGRMLGVGFLHQFIAAARRRSVPASDEKTQPCALIVDEFQNWVRPEHAPFMALARSSRVCCFLATQSLPGLVASVGGDHAQASIDSLLANAATKIALQSNDPQTCEWLSKMIGQRPRFRLSTQEGNRTAFGRQRFSVGYEREPWVYPDAFQFLSVANGDAEAIVLLGDKATRAIGQPYVEAVFSARNSVASADATPHARPVRPRLTLVTFLAPAVWVWIAPFWALWNHWLPIVAARRGATWVSRFVWDAVRGRSGGTP